MSRLSPYALSSGCVALAAILVSCSLGGAIESADAGQARHAVSDGDLLVSELLQDQETIFDKNLDVESAWTFDLILMQLEYRNDGDQIEQEIDDLCDGIATTSAQARAEYDKIRSLPDVDRYVRYADEAGRSLDLVPDACDADRLAAATLTSMFAAPRGDAEHALYTTWSQQWHAAASAWDDVRGVLNDAYALLDATRPVPSAAASAGPSSSGAPDGAPSATIGPAVQARDHIEFGQISTQRRGCWSSVFQDNAGQPDPGMQVSFSTEVTSRDSLKSPFVWIKVESTNPVDTRPVMASTSWGASIYSNESSYAQFAGPQLLPGETRTLEWDIIFHVRSAIEYTVTAGVADGRFNEPALAYWLSNWTPRTDIAPEDCPAGKTRP